MRCFDCNGVGRVPFSGFWDGERACGVALNSTLGCARCGGAGEVPEEMVEWKKFGDRVAGARRKLELSQRRVAGILGMRPSDYADMERGFKEPGEFFTIAWETIEKWAAGDEFQQQTKQQTNGNQKNRNQSGESLL